MRAARRFTALAAVVAALAVSGCDEPVSGPAGTPTAEPSAATPAFSHAIGDDQSGYFIPLREVKVGEWTLHHLFVGQAADFEAWEAGQRSATFAPVMLEFEDAASPMVQTELGESRSRRTRALPTDYAVTDSTVRFTAKSAELGEVRFEGRLDQGALATAKRNLGDEGAVLTGTLSVGGQTVRGLRFRWWMGD